MKNIKYLLLLIICLTIQIPEISAKSIINGTYTIKSILDTNKVIDLDNAQTTNNTNIQLYNNNGTNAQKWTITYQSDGYYTIASSINNNKVLTIKNENIANKSNIELNENNNSDSQKWDIIHYGKSNFEIRSKKGNFCIDLDNANTANRTNVQLYRCNNTNAQRFKFLENISPTQSIDDGTYKIKSAINENQVLDVSNGSTNNKTNIQLYGFNNTRAQKWNIKYLNNGYYSITSRLNQNKCLDVDNAIFQSGSNIQLYNCNNTTAQQWIIRQDENGYYNIITKGENHSLDLANGNTYNKTNVQIYYSNGSDAQKFKLEKLEDKVIEDGIYSISSSIDNSKVIDIDNANSEANTNIQLYTNNDTNAQKWYIKRLDNGYYTIRAGINSKLYLSNNNDSNVLTTITKTEWELQYIDNEQFYIISKDTGLFLNLENNKTDNKTNINLLTANESNAQKFYFNPTQINQDKPTFNDAYYTIETSLTQSKVIDIANGSKNNYTNVQLYNLNKSNAQIWYFKYLNNGYYSITSALNPRISLDLANGNTVSGTNIQIYKSNSTDAQQWKIIDDGNGNLSLSSKKANICLTVNNSSTNNGTNIQANTCNNQNNQKFNLIKYTDKKSYTGIDVSKYQGNIDWEKVAASNIGFVMIRAGWGDNWPSQDDEKFTEYVAGCEKYNIPYGVYLYSYAKKPTGSTALNANSESATSEAEHVIRLINSVNYKPNLKQSVYHDMEEEKLLYLGKNTLTSISDSFCSTIQSRGYGCGIYASTNYLNKYLNTPSLASKYSIWVAEWVNRNNKAPSYNTALTLKPGYPNYKLWQFSSHGSISGIYGDIDVDLGYDIFD